MSLEGVTGYTDRHGNRYAVGVVNGKQKFMIKDLTYYAIVGIAKFFLWATREDSEKLMPPTGTAP